MTDLALLGHSAVTITHADQQLLIDPGLFSNLTGVTATAVLVTHGHADHITPTALADTTAPVYAPQDVIDQLADAGIPHQRLHAVAPGDSFTAAGLHVTVVGNGQHAEIFPGLPPASNNGYLIDGRILHPGDALTDVPYPVAVEVLLLPVAAPWLKLADAIVYARRFPSATVRPIHDAILSGPGQQLTDTILATALGADTYHRR